MAGRAGGPGRPGASHLLPQGPGSRTDGHGHSRFSGSREEKPAAPGFLVSTRPFRSKATCRPSRCSKCTRRLTAPRSGSTASLSASIFPCFTPGYFHLEKALKGKRQENELVIRVGADREVLPEGMPTGWDFEKYLFIPGIYDSVDLILTGAPYIHNIQIAPDPKSQSIRVQAEILGKAAADMVTVRALVTEAVKGTAAGSANRQIRATNSGLSKVDLTIPVKNCRLWSPEDPFLYRLAADHRRRRGERSLRNALFPRSTRKASAPCSTASRTSCAAATSRIYRFFEDSERKDRPWREEWVRRLHRKFKDDEVEQPALLHRLSARVVVRHRRRRGIPDPGRVSDLAAR